MPNSASTQVAKAVGKKQQLSHSEEIALSLFLSPLHRMIKIFNKYYFCQGLRPQQQQQGLRAGSISERFRVMP